MPVITRSTTSNISNCISIYLLRLQNLPIRYIDIKKAIKKYKRYGWPRKIKFINIIPYFRCKYELQVVNGCLLKGNRVIVPQCHRQIMLKELHRSHLKNENEKCGPGANLVAKYGQKYRAADQRFPNMYRSAI